MDKSRELEYEDLKIAAVGKTVIMGCSSCESLEQHKKLEDGTWKCLWCGAEEIKIK